MMSATTDAMPRQGTRREQSFRPAVHHPHGRATLDAQLASEDSAEEALLLSADDRITCPVHRRWIHQCAASPAHVNLVTRHRWCRRCSLPLTVSVDEIAGTVTMHCPRCGDGSSPATTRLIAACRASLVESLDVAPAAA